jgi:hypothetical protein
VEIRVVDPADDVAVRRFWEIGKVADEVGRPWTPYWPQQAAVAAYRLPGTLLLDAAIDAARGDGRALMLGEVATPLDGPESAGMSFARRHGFAPVLVEEVKVADLPATEHLWDALAGEASPHHTGYRLVSWQDEVPDEYVDGYCALMESSNTESPTGELQVETERWDKNRLREKEERFRRSGRHELGIGALAADGRMVGLTEGSR